MDVPPIGIPPGWKLSTFQLAGGTPGFTIPAMPGISHVLTHITFIAVTFQGAMGPFTLEVLDGAVQRFAWILMAAGDIGPPVTVDRDSFDQDVAILGTAGNSMTIHTNFANGPNQFQNLMAEGFDI